MPPESSTVEAPEALSVEVPERISGSAPVAPFIQDIAPPKADSSSVQSIAPEAYKNEQWVKDIPNTDTLFKMVSDQKAALSRRPAGIPQDNAPQEEWAAFNKSLGVPEKPEDYSFAREGVEFSEEQKAFQDGLRPVLHKANITPKQLAELAPAWDEYVTAQNEARTAAQDAEFDKLSAQSFANEEDKQKAFAQTRELWKKYVPPEFQGHMADMDNKALIGLSLITKGFIKDYVSEDTLPGQGGAAGAATSQAEIKAEIAEIMSQAAFFKPHMIGHDALRQRSMELHTRLVGA